ncbi:F-box/kelch-repeat protein At3g23880-like [Quercus lobata]|uniref:F-box/kelch-repeat protein At3g23880-like n=1 Tax=Quercus lobata TaxID=97700 RepID=UPI0012481607|nr:F-box/kelch-repeat protein At3g23880-like [Quercus lobata]
MRESVPDDVVEDILGHLPVKSLTRFRCFSKSWNSIITDTTFINKHLKLNLNQSESSMSTNTHSGYLLYTTEDKDSSSSSKELCTVACNKDRTLTQVSRFEIPPFFDKYMIVGFCNGLFCLASPEKELCHVIYLWNPSIRMLKKLVATRFNRKHNERAAIGFAYDSLNNDFKILRIVCNAMFNGSEAEAEIYTLSSDSWRKVVTSMQSLRGCEVTEPKLGTICCVWGPFSFYNGALHALAFTTGYLYILSFDISDESFHEIMMPRNHLDGATNYFNKLAVYKGLLANFVFAHDFGNEHDGRVLCHVWVMEEYGVPESWTRKFVMEWAWTFHFFGCTNNGELLIKNATGLASIDPENQNQNILPIENANWVAFSANSMESLVLLDRVYTDRESEREEEEEKNSNVCSMDDLGGALGSGGGLGGSSSSSSGLDGSGDGHSRVTLLYRALPLGTVLASRNITTDMTKDFLNLRMNTIYFRTIKT